MDLIYKYRYVRYHAFFEKNNWVTIIWLVWILSVGWVEIRDYNFLHAWKEHSSKTIIDLSISCVEPRIVRPSRKKKNSLNSYFFRTSLLCSLVLPALDSVFRIWLSTTSTLKQQKRLNPQFGIKNLIGIKNAFWTLLFTPQSLQFGPIPWSPPSRYRWRRTLNFRCGSGVETYGDNTRRSTPHTITSNLLLVCSLFHQEVYKCCRWNLPRINSSGLGVKLADNFKGGRCSLLPNFFGLGKATIGLPRLS